MNSVQPPETRMSMSDISDISSLGGTPIPPESPKSVQSTDKLHEKSARDEKRGEPKQKSNDNGRRKGT